MGRSHILDAVLTHVAGLRTDDAIAICEAEIERDPDPWLNSLLSFAQYMAQDFAAAGASSSIAVDTSVDAESVAFARATSALASGGTYISYDGDPLADALADLDDLTGVDDDRRFFVVYILAEAALASARLELAATFVERAGPLPADFLATDGVPNPFRTIMLVMRARLLGFRGHVVEALAQLEGAPVVTGTAPALLVEATLCLLRGNAAQRHVVRAMALRLGRELPTPHDYISAGCYLLISYGLVAYGDVAQAARFVVIAGASPDLARLSFVDRALGFELLVSASLAEGDLSVAQAWRLRAEPLLAHPTAMSVIERINCRVALAEGDFVNAISWAEQALEHANADARAVEAADTEILLSRARIANEDRATAKAALESLSSRSIQTGHLSAHKAAVRELRAIGARLRPVAGSGWDGLSTRERDVALLLAEGFSNRDIARELVVSEHTVQAHVSRVLAAFGASSRFAVAAELNRTAESRHDLPLPAALTPRQWTVAGAISRGLGNEAIAVELGVSTKTVEKHVAEIRRRWQLSSRIAIGRLAFRDPRAVAKN